MSRRLAFWITAGLSALVLVAVAGAILYSLFNEEAVSSPDGALAYLTIFALVFSDAIIPVFPGETTLNTASVLASQGTLELGLVIVAGALGAVLGDSALCWLVRTGPSGLKDRLEATSQKDERVAKGLALLGRSGPLLIACGRFVPGVRFAVNVSMGLIEYPYRRFLLFSAIGGGDLGDLHLPARLLDRRGAGGFSDRLDRHRRRRHVGPHQRRLPHRPPRTGRPHGATAGAGRRAARVR